MIHEAYLTGVVVWLPTWYTASGRGEENTSLLLLIWRIIDRMGGL